MLVVDDLRSISEIEGNLWGIRLADVVLNDPYCTLDKNACAAL